MPLAVANAYMYMNLSSAHIYLCIYTYIYLYMYIRTLGARLQMRWSQGDLPVLPLPSPPNYDSRKNDNKDANKNNNSQKSYYNKKVLKLQCGYKAINCDKKIYLP